MLLQPLLCYYNELTSFSEYRDRATMSSSFRVSAWNSCLSAGPVTQTQMDKWINGLINEWMNEQMDCFLGHNVELKGFTWNNAG